MSGVIPSCIPLYIYIYISVTGAQADSVARGLDKFNQFCKPCVNVFTARHQCLTMKQNTRSINEFLTALKKKVRECTFGDLTDDMPYGVACIDAGARSGKDEAEVI